MKFFEESCQHRVAMQRNGCYEVSFGNEHAWCQQLHLKVTFGPKKISHGVIYMYILSVHHGLCGCIIFHSNFLTTNKSLQM